jgi:nucleoside-diphosphate-sugar epimerase
LKVLLIGASGFVGRHLMRHLLAEGIPFRAAVHRSEDGFPAGVEVVRGTRLDSRFDWSPALAGCDAVVHLGARVHIMADKSADPLADYRAINVDGTLSLGRQAISAGIRRFVFLSSIKVNGEATRPGQPFTASDAPMPLDPYGISKLEAENGLRALAGNTAMGVVVLRPPLVYGPGVRANFLSMMCWLHRGVPLPLGGIDNRRSLIGVDNLVDLIATGLNHPAAVNQTFLASDGEDLSTSELARRLAAALEKRAHLLPIPQAWLLFGGRIAGQGGAVTRLCASLQVDIGKTGDVLGWRPPVSVDEGLRRTANWFLNSRSQR